MEKKLNKDPVSEFFQERKADMDLMSKDKKLKDLTLEWMIQADRYKYTYNLQQYFE